MRFGSKHLQNQSSSSSRDIWAPQPWVHGKICSTSHDSLFCGAEPKSNQNMVGYPCHTCPNIAPIDISGNADHCYSFQIHQFFVSIFDFDVETFYSDVSSPQVACKTRSITMNILSSKETSRSVLAWFFLNFVTKGCSVFNNLVLHWQLRAVVRACTIWRIMGNKYPW